MARPFQRPADIPQCSTCHREMDLTVIIPPFGSPYGLKVYTCPKCGRSVDYLVSPLSKAFVALPAIAVVGFAIRYLSRNENRWPAAVSTLGLLGTLIAFAVVVAIG